MEPLAAVGRGIEGQPEMEARKAGNGAQCVAGWEQRPSCQSSLMPWLAHCLDRLCAGGRQRRQNAWGASKAIPAFGQPGGPLGGEPPSTQAGGSCQGLDLVPPAGRLLQGIQGWRPMAADGLKQLAQEEGRKTHRPTLGPSACRPHPLRAHPQPSEAGRPSPPFAEAQTEAQGGEAPLPRALASREPGRVRLLCLARFRSPGRTVDVRFAPRATVPRGQLGKLRPRGGGRSAGSPPAAPAPPARGGARRPRRAGGAAGRGARHGGRGARAAGLGRAGGGRRGAGPGAVSLRAGTAGRRVDAVSTEPRFLREQRRAWAGWAGRGAVSRGPGTCLCSEPPPLLAGPRPRGWFWADGAGGGQPE